MTTFFQLWDSFLLDGGRREETSSGKLTIVTVDDEDFEALDLRHSKVPLMSVPAAKRFLLGSQIIDQRIDPNDERLRVDGGLNCTTLSGDNLNLAYSEGTWTVSKAVKSDFP